jgi:hypothetical protein
MNGVAVEQVEETKLLGVTLDRCNGCKDGERSVCNKEMLCFFDTTLHKSFRTEQHILLFIVIRGILLILCISVTLG